MTWIMLTVVLLFAAATLFIAASFVVPESRRFVRAGGLLALLLWALVTFASSFHRVPAGHVGVVYEFGAIVGQTGDGGTFVRPWRDVKNADVRLQRHEIEGLSVASIETQDISLNFTLSYRVNPDAVQALYKEVGPDYFQNLDIHSRISQFFKDEVVQYNAIDVTRKRDEIRAAVAARLQEDLGAYSITVVTLLIGNISYTPDFEKSIEQKQVATQNALEAAERIKQREAEAAQAVAVAQGEADAIRTRAEGQAAANALIRSSLTTELIQYEAIQRLSDKIQIALIPSGQGILIDPSAILSPPPDGP